MKKISSEILMQAERISNHKQKSMHLFVFIGEDVSELTTLDCSHYIRHQIDNCELSLAIQFLPLYLPKIEMIGLAFKVDTADGERLYVDIDDGTVTSRNLFKISGWESEIVSSKLTNFESIYQSLLYKSHMLKSTLISGSYSTSRYLRYSKKQISKAQEVAESIVEKLNNCV